MFRLNKKYRDNHTILKNYGFKLTPTREGYTKKIYDTEIYIPIRTYDKFVEFYVYICPECATIITHELDQIIALFEMGILENYL